MKSILFYLSTIIILCSCKADQRLLRQSPIVIDRCITTNKSYDKGYVIYLYHSLNPKYKYTKERKFKAALYFNQGDTIVIIPVENNVKTDYD